ncbi:uncharacterized protein LOC122280573 isoform X2 [Carya illinoinensis]|uniref:uncharacterized protein LOC122280573 isoform X2 n=1 Tax=Carya illinoinensis TaxID=32201 RepID=UPI001C727208|nr:uncharacterized protein LOC122280573 isoform X2 [Carya illinoinensis]
MDSDVIMLPGWESQRARAHPLPSPCLRLQRRKTSTSKSKSGTPSLFGPGILLWTTVQSVGTTSWISLIRLVRPAKNAPSLGVHLGFCIAQHKNQRRAVYTRSNDQRPHRAPIRPPTNTRGSVSSIEAAVVSSLLRSSCLFLNSPSTLSPRDC